MMPAHLTAILFYLRAVFDDGDWLNDWRRHLPADLALYTTHLGCTLVHILGIGD